MRDVDRLMLTLPNMGSTWFAALLAKHLPGCNYYDKEFFNPVCNLKHADRLQRGFGSELVSCYRNIATEGDCRLPMDIAATWGKEDYTFTKETFSVMKVWAFAQRFNCFVFLRSEENSFPPSRARVWSFYEHAWHAFYERGMPLKEKTIDGRMHEIYRHMRDTLIVQAANLELPVIWWEDLFMDDEERIARNIESAVGLMLPELACEIVATRKLYKRKHP